jgi:transposase
VTASREALGRSRGGLSTKIHLVADRRCRPIVTLLTPGQQGDSPRFIPLMDSIRIRRPGGVGRPRERPALAMADKAYKERNTVERCVNKLRQHRAVATRHDKRERIYQGTIDVASLRIWLRDPVT